MRATLVVGSLCLAGSVLAAQAPPAAPEFDVVSIKRSPADATGGGMQTLPDGGFIMTNSPVRSILLAASPVPAREIEGAPAWVDRERYDIIAKAPAGATRQHTRDMMRRVFEDRMKLKGHVEERERTVFALVPARSDGRLGPQLKPSTLDCRAPVPPRSPQQLPTEPPEARCGGAFGRGLIVSGGITMDQLVLSLSGLAGGQVINRTGLQGFYALTLRYSMPPAAGGDPPADDAPEPITAIREQLGLKFQPEQMKVPVFVVDSIERPSEN
jgi:uncharacterized protein (TIGR03435 family)